MKKFPIILMLAAVAALIASCVGQSVEDEYKDWRQTNTEWFSMQVNRTDASGKSYYKMLGAPWDPSAQTLIHWHNDTMLTRNNLKPLYTSTVDVKYRLRLYDGTAIDSSYTSTSPADSVTRFVMPGTLIEGWVMAMMNMHVGDSCSVIVPYQQGYGSVTMGKVKPFSTLVFDIKLVSIYGYETN